MFVAARRSEIRRKPHVTAHTGRNHLGQQIKTTNACSHCLEMQNIPCHIDSHCNSHNNIGFQTQILLCSRNSIQRPLERLDQLARLLQPNTKPNQVRFHAPFRTPVQLAIMRQNHIRRAERKVGTQTRSLHSVEVVEEGNGVGFCVEGGGEEAAVAAGGVAAFLVEGTRW